MSIVTVTTEQVHELIKQLAAQTVAASITPEMVANIFENMRQLNDQEREKVIATAEAYIAEIQNIGISAEKVEYGNRSVAEEIGDLQHDGQVVGAKVAGLETNSATKEEVKTRYGDVVEDFEYIKVITDQSGHILFAIKNDGSIEWYKGVPQPIKDYQVLYLDSRIGNAAPEHLNAQLSRTDEEEWLYTFTDSNGVILFGIKNDGSVEWYKGVPSAIKKFVKKNLDQKVPLTSTYVDCNSGHTNINSRLSHPYGSIVYNTPYREGDVNTIAYIQALYDAGIRFVGFNVNSGVRNNIPFNDLSQTGKEMLVTLNKLIKKANDLGMKVMLTHYGVPRMNLDTPTTGTIPYENWIADLQDMASYDGTHSMRVSMEGATANLTVNYFRAGDEMSAEYTRYGFTPTDCLRMYSDAARTIRGAYKNGSYQDGECIIVGCTNNVYRAVYFDELVTAVLDNGDRYVNTFDIQYVDVYIDRPEDGVGTVANIYKNFAQHCPEILNKPLWFCNGYTLCDFPEEELAKKMIRNCIIAFSYGAEQYNQFRGAAIGSVGPNNREEYFYLIHPSVENSYVSFYKGDGSEGPITVGDASSKMYIGFPSQTNDGRPMYLDLIKNVLDRAKQYGIEIKGSNYKITGVVVKSSRSGEVLTTIYDSTPINVDTDSLVIPASTFISIPVGSVLCVSYSDAYTPNEVSDTIEGTQMYYKIQHLQTILNEGCTKPQIVTQDGLYIAVWKNADDVSIHAVWALFPADCSISYNGSRCDVYNSDMEYQTGISLQRMHITSDPVFFIGPATLKISRI